LRWRDSEGMATTMQFTHTTHAKDARPAHTMRGLLTLQLARACAYVPQRVLPGQRPPLRNLRTSLSQTNPSFSKTLARWLAPDPSTPSPPFACHANIATLSHARMCWLGMAVCAKAWPGVAGGDRRSDLCGVRSGRSVRDNTMPVLTLCATQQGVGGWRVGSRAHSRPSPTDAPRTEITIGFIPAQ
jgi:hypothetical protein